MRLDEIMTLKYMSDNGALQRLTKQYNEAPDKTLIKNSGKYKIVQASRENDDGVRWFVVEGDKPVGLVSFAPRTGIRKIYYTSTYAWLDNSLRGQGLVSDLYRAFIKEYGALMSDYEQSDSAKKIWKSLAGDFYCYGLYWNENEEQEWGLIDSKEELEKAWQPVDKYKRLLLSTSPINTKE